MEHVAGLPMDKYEDGMHSAHYPAMFMSLFVAFLGIFMSSLFYFFKTFSIEKAAYFMRKIYLFNLSRYKFYIDSIYDNVLYKPFKKPDLIIFIDRSLSELMNNIFLRGRTFEQKIDKSYIESLSIGYENWLKTISYPVLRINANEIDINNPDKLKNAFKMILEQDYQHIQRRIHLKELIK